MILRLGDTGAAVADLQRRLFESGYKLEQTHIYDQATVTVVRQLQARGRLVADGIYGPKTEAYLRGGETGYLLKQSDIEAAAKELGVDVGSVMAVNEVESLGSGFIQPDMPRILFERHVFWRQLLANGIQPASLASKYPGILSQSPGGYVGGRSEYTRLTAAVGIHRQSALESASWGAFQIMGFHWERLGYESVDAYVAAMSTGEGAQLVAFVRFILADKSLHAALKGKRWSTFARLYNGPAYANNLYDVKLSRAYKRYEDLLKAAA